MIVFLLVAVCSTWQATAQELEPRSLTNVPVGTNFLHLGYAYTTGNVLLDPSLAIEGLDAKLNMLTGGYVRSIGLFGDSAKIGILVPFLGGDWSTNVAGVDSIALRTGFGDPRLLFAINFVGAPATDPGNYAAYVPGTVIGAQFSVILPLGQYDPGQVMNLGSNRWAFKPQVGLSRTTGDWILEGYLAGWFFTNNPDFYGGNQLKQDPLGTAKLHAIYTLPRSRMWLAGGVGYAYGGRLAINGQQRDSRISTLRWGVTLSLPVAEKHTLKLSGTAAVRQEKGPDYDAVTLSYQYRWGL